MVYFSGFSFADEREIFERYIEKSDFSVAGFSYGAQKALDFCFTCKKRVDKLQLFSPAFFMDKDEKFKKLQLISFKKNKAKYIENFMQNIGNKDLKRYAKESSYEELKELLYYDFDKDILQAIVERGTEIEVYLGANDKIINALHVKEFFKEFATVYYTKNVGHSLH